MINIRLSDPFTNSTQFVNGQTIKVEISGQDLIEKYLVTEDPTIPDNKDPRYSKMAPTLITVASSNVATVYLWAKTIEDTIESVSASIQILPDRPLATFKLRGIVGTRGQADILLETSPGIKGYAISDTEPNIFSPNKPTKVFFDAIENSITIWLQDENNKTSSFLANFYDPPDNLLAHRPGLFFTDENNAGIKGNILRVSNLLGDYIQWNAIKFNPIGRNFSRFRLDKTSLGYKITTLNEGDTKYLADNQYWDSVEVHLTDVPQKNLTIFQNDDILYTQKTIVIGDGLDSIAINESLTFKPSSLDGELNIIDFVSQNNKIHFQIDDYDFHFLKRLLQHHANLQTNFQAFSDLQLNYSDANKTTVNIAAFLDKDMTFLPRYCQAEIQLTERDISRLEDFNLSEGTTIAPSDSGAETDGVAIKKTKIIAKNKTTSDHHPKLDFEIINAPNSYAEFTIQISNDREFSSPNTIAFRINESDNRLLTLEGEKHQEITFLETDQMGFGTVFWRVRRNQSEFSEPAILTIRSSPVIRLEFLAESEFSKEIGHLARIKVAAYDAFDQPVEGAKIDFSTGSFLNTDNSGTAENFITMPTKEQEFLLTIESESRQTNHFVEALDSPHLVSEIKFDNSAPPVVRYIVFRKEFAEVRSTDESQVLMISQTPNSPIVRKDSVEPQPGVVFDPQKKNLIMARNILPPRPVDRQHRSINITNVDCDLHISWSPAEKRGTTWFYDAKSSNNQNNTSEDFSITNGEKFDVISMPLANGDTLSPSPYPSEGDTFKAYILEKIDAKRPSPTRIATNATGIIDTGYGGTPDPVTNLSGLVSGPEIVLSWTNPSPTQKPAGEFVYRIASLDVAGNKSISKITSPPAVTQCIMGIIVTRINSTECFQEEIVVHTLDVDLPLVHGAILSKSLIVKKGEILLKNGIDYLLNSAGNENLGLRGKIHFLNQGIVDVGDTVSIAYRYGRSIESGEKPTTKSLIVDSRDGSNFSGPGLNDTAQDSAKLGPVAYTYGLWTKTLSGEISTGSFIQVLVDS